MNVPARLLCLALLGGAFLAPGRAQLVHLAFTEGDTSGLIFRATSATIPWNHAGGYVSRFDLWYDVNNPLDPTRNLWRAKVNTHGLGAFEIIRPVQSLFFDEYGYLTLSHQVLSPFEVLDFSVEIFDLAPDPGLPVPPFELGTTYFSLHGGRSFFDIPDLAEGYGGTSFGRATARVVQTVDLYPVPEPSTYALGALALLGVVLARAKWSPARGHTRRRMSET